jgi:hypothetical protein
MALFSSSLDTFYLLFASSSRLTIGSIDAMDFGAETCDLPPDFRPVSQAARAAALYGRRKPVFDPMGFEGDCGNFAVVGPTGGDKLGALRRTAVQHSAAHHSLVAGLIQLDEPSPEDASSPST